MNESVVQLRTPAMANEQLAENARKRIAYRKRVKAGELTQVEIVSIAAALNAELDEIERLYDL